MPQKALFSRMPLLDQRHCALSRGQIRAEMPEIIQLYEKIRESQGTSEILEASFSLSTLVCEKPDEEPASRKIREKLLLWEKGDYSSVLREEIALARAALALYEYTTEKRILQILAGWCRHLEVNWDQFNNSRQIRIQPADLMEFLVRYYRITGLKPVLRLCARLRTSAMDWTTILQKEPDKHISTIIGSENKAEELLSREDFSQLDYDEKTLLTNHSGILADGMRYTAYSSLYSGHEQELKAGRNGWEHLYKSHHAVCGGLTADPFLTGGRTDTGNDPETVAAWTEALIAQMQIDSGPWVLDEITRIVHNSLLDILKTKNFCKPQYVNVLTPDDAVTEHGIHRHDEICGERRKLGRIARAVSLVYQHAVTLTRDSVCLNWQIPGRFLFQSNGSTVLLQEYPDRVLFSMKESACMKLAVYHAATDTTNVILKTGKEKKDHSGNIPENLKTGFYLIINREWETGDTLLSVQGNRIHAEKGHHQGICFFTHNQLMVHTDANICFPLVPNGMPEFKNGNIILPVCRIKTWPVKNGIPGDIPVLPSPQGATEYITLKPYAGEACRISLFPGNKIYD